VAGTAAISALGSAFLAQAHYRGRITEAEHNLASILAHFNQTEAELVFAKEEILKADREERYAVNRIRQADHEKTISYKRVDEANAREAALKADLAASAEREKALQSLRGAIVDGGVDYAAAMQEALDALAATEKELDRLRADLAAAMEQVRGSPENQEGERIKTLSKTITGLTRENAELRRHGVRLERREDKGLDELQKTIEKFEQNLAAYPKGVWAQHAGGQHVAPYASKPLKQRVPKNAIVPKPTVPPNKEPQSRASTPEPPAAVPPQAARGDVRGLVNAFQKETSARVGPQVKKKLQQTDTSTPVAQAPQERRKWQPRT
jgi:hypothetical protein